MEVEALCNDCPIAYASLDVRDPELITHPTCSMGRGFPCCPTPLFTITSYAVEMQPSKNGYVLVAAEVYVRCKMAFYWYHIDGWNADNQLALSVILSEKFSRDDL